MFKIFLKYPRIILKLFLNYPRIILKLFLNYPRIILKLFLNYPRSILKLFLNYPRIILKLFLNHPRITLKLFLNYPRIILKLFLNYPRIILKLFLNTKGATLPKNLRNMFQSFFMLYYILKLSKTLYFVSIIQTASESSIVNRMQKISYFFMKLKPHIILKLFLNLGDFEPQYCYNFILIKKEFIDRFYAYMILKIYLSE